MRLFIALALLAFIAAPAAAATCPYQARCGSIRVPLDHSGATPGTLPIGYATLPATGPKTGTIFFLSGGPGEAAVAFTGLIRKEFAPLRRTHDIVMVDQRGTGRSGAVHCEFDENARACAKKLGNKRAFLTTVETARDLDDLRAALGLEKITPLGISYGTKVAGEYARRFPDRTASVILDSPVGVDPIDFDALGGIAALPRILRETCASGPCAQTVRDAGAALFAAVKRVRRSPVRLDNRREGRVDERDVFLVLRMSDFDPVTRADLPAALASLARGDAAPFVHLFNRGSDIGLHGEARLRLGLQSNDEYSESRFLATACLEARLPWSPASALSTRAAAKRAYLTGLGSAPFAPFSPSTVSRFGIASVCAKWPATPAPEPPPAATPDVPVLVISGRDDVRTPLEGAQAVAAAYPHATVLAVPHIGHSVLTSDEEGCALAGAAAFLAAQPVAQCETKAVLPAGAFHPAALPGGAGKAAEITVEGIRHDLEAARVMSGRDSRFELRGLRGGYSLVRRGRLDLRNVSWFRGLRVSGRLSAAGNGTLALRGTRTGTVVLRAFKAQPFKPATQ